MRGFTEIRGYMKLVQYDVERQCYFEEQIVHPFVDQLDRQATVLQRE